MRKSIFITGCCGYIGSHTTVDLLSKDYNVIGLDNFSNSSKEVLNGIKKISKKEIIFYEGDARDENIINNIFSKHKIDLVIDFAAFKSVGDSNNRPLEYYDNNVASMLNVLKCMKKFGIFSFIFSSSATVYGENNKMPVNEKSRIGKTKNPYGTSKLISEYILKDLYNSSPNWNICIFRYFNPVGAHKSKLIGEDINGVPSNLMPRIIYNIDNPGDIITIFGTDYDTNDGTGVRDFIHIQDLSRAHVNATELMLRQKKGYRIYNLGTGKGYSVLELIDTFQRVNNVKINYKFGDRRVGDVARCYADVRLAEKELCWKAIYSLEDMCIDSYNYYNFKNSKTEIERK